jgi:hypothetical protein
MYLSIGLDTSAVKGSRSHQTQNALLAPASSGTQYPRARGTNDTLAAPLMDGRGR